MLSVHFVFGSEATTVVNANLKGMRFCFLYRFILEFLEFNNVFFVSMSSALNPASEINNELVDPIDGELQALDESSGDESSSEEDGENSGSDSNSDSSSSDDSSTSDGSSYENVGIRTIRSAAKSFPDYSVDHQAVLTPRRALRFSVKPNIVPQIDFEEVENTVLLSNQEQQKRQNVMKWSIKFEDLTVVCPRNSFSSDIVAFRISKGMVENRDEISSWAVPEGVLRSSEKKSPLYFDLVTNSWQFSSLSIKDSFFDSSLCSSLPSGSSEVGDSPKSFWELPHSANKTGMDRKSRATDEEEEDQFFDAIGDLGGKQTTSSDAKETGTGSGDPVNRVSIVLSSVSVYISIPEFRGGRGG
jgi:hypothetical protein